MDWTLMIIAFSYLIFLMLLIRGWKGLKAGAAISGKERQPGTIRVSVVIPVRNEVENIAGLFRDLENQRYPSHDMEVIFVDDHSVDGSYEKLREMQTGSELKIRIFRSPHPENTSISPKKSALTYGVEKAEGEYILQTDADTHLGENWIRSHLTLVENDDPAMVCGPVMMKSSNFREHIQAIEFSSLVATGAALLYYRIPSMCNGANLAYRKAVFEDLDGFAGNRHIISGDDEFLLYKVFRNYPNQVFFLKSVEATTWIDPLPGWSDFYHQRKRWAGKWRKHINPYSVGLALYVFLVHTAYLGLLVAGLLRWLPSSLIISIWLIRILLEYLYFRSIFSFYRLSLKIFPFITTSLLYSFYAVTFGILSNVGGFEWKGRKYKQ